jgi:hypothetical protein
MMEYLWAVIGIGVIVGLLAGWVMRNRFRACLDELRGCKRVRKIHVLICC